MGGIGSGGSRVLNPRKRVERLPLIDINQCRRRGLLSKGTASVSIFGSVLPVTWSTNRGATTGHRPWFQCPCCKRRSTKLYSLSGLGNWLCRLCLGLTYQSSIDCKDAFARSCDRITKLKQQLGDLTASAASPIPPRPRYMRHAVYWQIVQEILQEQQRSASAMAGVLAEIKGGNAW